MPGSPISVYQRRLIFPWDDCCLWTHHVIRRPLLFIPVWTWWTPSGVQFAVGASDTSDGRLVQEVGDVFTDGIGVADVLSSSFETLPSGYAPEQARGPIHPGLALQTRYRRTFRSNFRLTKMK